MYEMLFFQTRVQRGDGRVRDGAVKRSYETHEENHRHNEWTLYVSLIRLLFPHSQVYHTFHNYMSLTLRIGPNLVLSSIDRDASESVNIVIRNGLSGTKLPINSNHRVNES